MTSLAPPDLTLTEQEWANADEIRDVVTSSEDFEGISLTDFEYAQHALFTDGNLEDALFRIKGLHDFREEYKITSDPSKSVEEGMSLLRAFIKQHPWLLLDVSCDASSGYCCLIFDFAKLDPSAAKMPEQYRTFIDGFYYLFELLQPSFECMRNGLVLFAECEGYGWKNFSVDFHRQNFYHFKQFYPMRTRAFKFVHTTVIVNMLHSFLKTIKRKDAEKIQLGCPLDSRLDDFLKDKDPVEAEKALLKKVGAMSIDTVPESAELFPRSFVGWLPLGAAH